MQFSYLLTTVLAGLAAAAPLSNKVERNAPTKAIEKRIFPLLLGLVTGGAVAGGTAAGVIKEKEQKAKQIEEQKKKQLEEARVQLESIASVGIPGVVPRAVDARDTAPQEESTAKGISLPQIHELFAEIEEMVTAQLSAEIKVA